MHALRHPVFLSIAAIATLAAGAAWADPAASCGSVTGQQRRIVERADQGMPSLRGFIDRTAPIHGVEMIDVQRSLDTWRAAVACQAEVAAAAHAATETARADDAGKLLPADR